MILLATLGGLITLLFWGIGDYLLSKSSKKINPYLANLIVQSIGLIIFFPIVIVYGFSTPQVSTIVSIALMSTMFTVAFLSFVKALSFRVFKLLLVEAVNLTLTALAQNVIFVQLRKEPTKITL